MSQLRIGELAEAAGVRKDTIRYYERTGLLPAPQRTSTGYRVYHRSDIDRIRFVRLAQRLGFSLAETQALLLLQSGDAAGTSAILAVALGKLWNAERNVAQLNRIRTILELMAQGPQNDAETNTCPILPLVFNGDWADLQAQEPEKYAPGEDETPSTEKD